jgi:hypothetical protein
VQCLEAAKVVSREVGVLSLILQAKTSENGHATRRVEGHHRRRRELCGRGLHAQGVLLQLEYAC